VILEPEARIKSALKRAVELVEEIDIKDAELRKAALACCFEGLMGVRDHSTRAPRSRRSSAMPSHEPQTDSGDFWTNLSEKTRVADAALKDVFDLDQNRVLVVLPRAQIKGDTTREKRKWHAALVLYGYKAGLGQDYVGALLLSAAATHSSIFDEHYGRDLSESGWFKCLGAAKGRRYGLNAGGLKAARDYLAELTDK
jgi:hypothetical protein